MINTIFSRRNIILVAVLLYLCLYKNLYSQNNPAKPTFQEFMQKYSQFDEYI
ncbi:hypothetical protein BH718_02145 [Brachyspira hyodysenteriae]|nr:hypothetical protein BH718_02145 [Brachyspira hyodysenteriae]